MEGTNNLGRRDFIKAAVAAGIGGSTLAILAGCQSQAAAPKGEADKGAAAKGDAAKGKDAAAQGSDLPEGTTAKPAPDGTVKVGDTLANLKTAIQGETNAKHKYETYAGVAEKEGYDQIARLFKCTAEAEQTHIDNEIKAAKEIDSSVELPKPGEVKTLTSNWNLIDGANGEIYETSIMYPSFIEVAKKEDQKKALLAFEYARAAEGYHAELYLDLYNNIDNLKGEKYYRCPVCGYIRKGNEDTSACPICATPFKMFVEH